MPNHLEEIMSKLGRVESKIDSLHREQKRLKIKTKELEDRFRDGDIDDEKYRKKRLKIDMELESILAKLKELNQEKKELSD
jgi:predicted transcriptional regulator